MAPLTGEIATLDILPVGGHIKRGRYVSAHLHLSVGYLLVTGDARPPRGNEEENRGARWVPAEQLTPLGHGEGDAAAVRQAADASGQAAEGTRIKREKQG